MATIFKSTGHAQFDKLLEKATSNLLLEPEWASIMQICDLIRQKDCQPKYAIAQLKKKLHHQNPHVSFYGLQVLESVVKNCGSPVHEEVAAKQFMEELRELAKTTHHENVREKILELIQTWAHAFRKISSYRAVQDVLNIMKTEGAKFPPLVEADAMFVADQAPDWADGECCHRCRVEFTFTQRKHHCRACGQIFCNKCSGKECTLPRFGIEKEVRVCDACFEKYGRDSIGPGGSSSGGTPSSSLDEHHMHMPTTRGSSGTAVGGSASNGLQAKGGIDSRGGGGGLIGSSSSSSATSGSVGGVVGGGGGGDNKPSAKELELAEEEQLQLALAISQSEAEAKEQEMKARKARMYNTNALMSTITTTTTNNSKQAESMIGARTTTTSPPRTQSPPDSSGGQNEDPELSRYLNRAYWENKSNDANAVMSGGGVTTTNHSNNKTASISSNSNSSSSSSTFTPSAPLKLVSTNFGTVPAPAEIISTATQKIGPITEEDLTIDTFLDTLRTQIEMFVNRMKSNSSRGRPIANDTSVQSLFMSITHMHSQLLAYIQIQDNQRGRYEMLQDKLNQVRDARAALDDLRNEHAEALRRQQEEQERIRQYQMAQKLALMRQKKNEYLQYQRQLAMQRMQEQEREMQMRIAQQGVVGVVGGVPPQQQQQPASGGGGGVQQPPQAQQWGTTPGHLPGYPPTHMGAQPGMYGMPPPQQQQQQQQPPQAWPNQPPSVPAAPQQQQQIPMMSSPTTSGPPQPTIPQQQPQGGQQQMMYGGGAPPPQPQPTGSDPNLHQAAQQQHSDPNLIMQQQVQQVQQQQPQPGEVLQQQPVVSQPPQDLQAPQQQAPPPPAPQLQPPAAVAELISFD